MKKIFALAAAKALVEEFDRACSGNLKIIGIGNGATFVNTALAPTDEAGHIAGILTIDGKPGKTPTQTDIFNFKYFYLPIFV